MSIWSWLWAKAVSKLLGDGFAADVAGRASVYLVDEARKAVDRDEIPVSNVRLRPGESFTVVARPAPTRQERALAKRKASLQSQDRHLAAPTRRQRRAARKLRAAQRRLDRRRVGTRRHASAAAREAVRGARFDRLMAPSRKQVAVHDELERVSTELDVVRAERFAAVRRRRGLAGRKEQVRFHDAAED
ncbi:hypothetical protein [Dermatobacter hominis]|uniref:hypothetical protein n=1 Tax=Dermatobacter hominis TaxID=2884263 RepID=UPI001D105425|nr:hypothetical protein [Dermatobacter hominis]UDY36404.1 hypothetical protein LH044_02450 [Dermatobacter hominis]